MCNSPGAMQMKRMLPTVALAVAASGCGSKAPPKGIRPVADFDVQSYLGVWHEIARLDHSFERGLEQVIAEYALRPDGMLRVLNKGFDPIKGQWRTAEGRARFTGPTNVASLQVSFFGPFHGGYHVFALDPERYALVTGSSHNYLWLLAREKALPDALQSDLLARAAAAGFGTNALTWVKQTP